jgi:hypothetical protein
MVRSPDENANPAWLECIVDGVGNLGCEFFLDLQAFGKGFDNPAEVADAHHAPIWQGKPPTPFPGSAPCDARKDFRSRCRVAQSVRHRLRSCQRIFGESHSGFDFSTIRLAVVVQIPNGLQGKNVGTHFDIPSSRQRRTAPAFADGSCKMIAGQSAENPSLFITVSVRRSQRRPAKGNASVSIGPISLSSRSRTS